MHGNMYIYNNYPEVILISKVICADQVWTLT